MDTLLLNICVLSRWTKRLVGLFEEFTGSSGKQEDNIYVHAYLIFRLFRTYFIDNLFHFMRDFRKYTIRKMLVVSADNIDFIFTFFLYNLVNIINFISITIFKILAPVFYLFSELNSFLNYFPIFLWKFIIRIYFLTLSIW